MSTRIMLIIITASLVFLSGQIFAANAVSVSKIDGFDSTSGGLMANTPIRFYINYEVGAKDIWGITNAYHFYSTNGAMWQPIFAQPTVMVSNYFDSFIFLEFGITGSGADTLDLWAFIINTSGLPSGFDSNLFFIETKFSEDQIGKTVCLDTTSRKDVDPFSWVNSNIEQVIPSWDGLHCFEIVDCCAGHRGDINGDGKGPNILDLTRLVDYIFRGAPAPDCQLESDVNSDGLPYRITDLTYIVDYMHRGGPLPESCP